MRWDNQWEDGPHEAGFLKLDCSKLKKTFDWRPRWSIEDAIDKTVEWTKIYFANKNVPKIMSQQIAEFIKE